tara:strand:+ start:3769 stop:4722 length:954 start_codon:yes stop_codon:yes gene_type:complete
MKFEKTYLSRAMTKAMSADHPIGDPTGGPAYGERNDPVSAIIAVSTMASTYAVAGTFAAMTIAQGLIFAGAAINLVGNASGNEKLMKVGLVVGLAGGIGGMMSDPTSGFNTKMSEAFSSNSSSAANATTAANAQTANTVGNQATGTSNVAGTNAVTPPIDVGVAATTPLTPNYEFPGANAATDASGYSGFKTASNTPNALKLDAMGTDPGLIDKAMGYIEKNPTAALMLGQTAGGVAEGVMDMASGKSGAAAEQLEADAAYRTAMADKTKRETALSTSRIAQLNANLKAQQGGQFTVNPNAVTIAQQPAGLIAGARA